MAEKRMFARDVISAARFLRMPPASRLLYYDLGMYADDDGAVEAFTVMRTTGATENDLQVLVEKGFVRLLNDDLVALIVEWKRNNYIRPDRYKASKYAGLIAALEAEVSPPDSHLHTNGLPMVYDGDTQNSIGEDSIDKGSVGEVCGMHTLQPQEPPPIADRKEPARRFVPPTVEEVAAYCLERGNHVDAQRFVDYYAGVGWKRGKTPIKDWRACVRTWERDNQGSRPFYPQQERSRIKTEADYAAGLEGWG